jgi:hypothetical protein
MMKSVLLPAVFVRVDAVSEQRYVRNAILAGMCLTHFMS